MLSTGGVTHIFEKLSWIAHNLGNVYVFRKYKVEGIPMKRIVKR
jgi:hypothetical protein